jgi:hypothetical protein
MLQWAKKKKLPEINDDMLLSGKQPDTPNASFNDIGGNDDSSDHDSDSNETAQEKVQRMKSNGNTSPNDDMQLSGKQLDTPNASFNNDIGGNDDSSDHDSESNETAQERVQKRKSNGKTSPSKRFWSSTNTERVIVINNAQNEKTDKMGMAWLLRYEYDRTKEVSEFSDKLQLTYGCNRLFPMVPFLWMAIQINNPTPWSLMFLVPRR